jgi:Phosphopantothenoylcysteine synthetase/decarboxylase
MDLDMYAHEATKQGLALLELRKVTVIKAASGFLASGLEGEGRMAEPETIITEIQTKLSSELSLFGRKVLITAGPTREPLDPVRFFSNYSTGTMGYELALRAYELGAEVTLISGPVAPIIYLHLFAVLQ